MRLLPEESLLLSAAEMPVLSAGLRSRVLAAAMETDRRRSQGRRALWVAGILTLSLGLTAWRGPLSIVGEGLAGFGASRAYADEPQYESRAPLLNVSQRYGRGELLLLAAGDDWQLVEAEIQSRREGYRQIRISY